MSAPKAVQAPVLDDPRLALAAVGTATCLGLALQLANGYATPLGLKLLVLAFVAPCACLLLPRPNAAPSASLVRALHVALVAVCVVQASLLTSYPPAKYLQLQRLDQLWPLHFGVFAVLAAAMAPAGDARAEACYRAVMVLAALAMGHWLVRYSPAPHVDVFTYAKEAPAGLLQGHNPYAMRFTDVYGGGTNAYAEGLSDGTQTTVGFPYLPINLWVLTLGAFLPDPRWVLQLCTVLGAWLAMRHAPCPARARLAMAALLCTPRAMFLLEQSFLEPIAIALLAATAVAASRNDAKVPYLLGALLVTKQPMPLLAASAFVLPHLPSEPRERLRFAGKVVASGTALTLPFILLDPQAFYRSAIWVHFKQLRTPDSLTLASWWVQGPNGFVPPIWWCFVLLAATGVLVVRRAPRTASGFALAFGTSYLAFLLFARQAYANYHHQVTASMFLAAALADFGQRKASR